MSFHPALQRLRHAVTTRQRGMPDGTMTVRCDDLRQLLEHFDRLDRDARMGGHAQTSTERPAPLGGVLYVTRDELVAIKGIMIGKPGGELAEAKAVHDLLGLPFDHFAATHGLAVRLGGSLLYHSWLVVVVDEVIERISLTKSAIDNG